MLELILTLILATILYFSIGVLVRFMANNELYWTFVPANTYALVTTKATEATEIVGKTPGPPTVTIPVGGNVTDLVHSIPGKKLEKGSDPEDQMEWKFIKDEEKRDLFFDRWGAHKIGIFRDLRMNTVRTFRYGRKDGQEEYHLMPQDMRTKFVYYSGQHDILVKGVETLGGLKFDLLFNVMFDVVYPVRAMLRVADAHAVLSMMTTEQVIGLVGNIEPEKLLEDEEAKRKLIKAIEDASTSIEDHIGIKITKVNLADVTFDEDTRRLMELDAKTKRENEAEIAKAEKDRIVAEKKNEADADRVKKVIIPLSENPNRIAVRALEAYERNTRITTFAPVLGAGGESALKLLVPVQPASEHTSTSPVENPQ